MRGEDEDVRRVEQAWDVCPVPEHLGRLGGFSLDCRSKWTIADHEQRDGRCLSRANRHEWILVLVELTHPYADGCSTDETQLTTSLAPIHIRSLRRNPNTVVHDRRASRGCGAGDFFEIRAL